MGALGTPQPARARQGCAARERWRAQRRRNQCATTPWPAAQRTTIRSSQPVLSREASDFSPATGPCAFVVHHQALNSSRSIAYSRLSRLPDVKNPATHDVLRVFICLETVLYDVCLRVTSHGSWQGEQACAP